MNGYLNRPFEKRDGSSDRIVVCGAGGFVGRALVKFLVERGYDVTAVSSPRRSVITEGASNVQVDLQDARACERALEGANWVFNFAAKVGGIDYIEKHKASCMLSSVINTNLLLAAKKHGVSRYFFSSSSCVYPDGIQMLKESDAYPASPIDGYGWEKLFSERMCLAFQEEYGVPVSIARYHGLYGPGDVREEERDHAIAALCRKVVEAKLSGQHEINIWGDGSQTRSFLYIDDCVEGTLKMAWKGVSGPLNLANSECVSINDLITTLEDIACVHLNRYYDLTASTGRKHKCSDNTQTRAMLDWEPMTPIRLGLERTYRECWDRRITK
jgi:nucleoside-diphosphate-sugar epimerase